MDSTPPARSRRLTYRGRRLAIYEATREAKREPHALDVLAAEQAADEALGWLREQVAVVSDEAELDRAWASIRRW